MARLFSLYETVYREVKGRFDANAREAARKLLEAPAFAEGTARYPCLEAMLPQTIPAGNSNLSSDSGFISAL
jgi:hypothetical protein